MDDLIRRQEAIDYIDRAITAWSEDKEIAIDCLRNLPFVQPETDSNIEKEKKMNYEICDPVELVRDLADKIGINQLYAIARDMRGESDTAIDNDSLMRENTELKHHIQFLTEDKAMMQGEINGLRFAVRCNGVSGADVN